jgi:hypothetical protein
MMADWLVLEPPTGAKQGDPVFVRDTFRWMGFFAPPLWLLWHGLWPEALLTVAVLFAINGLAASGAVDPSIGLLTSLVGLLIAFEGPAMRVASLRRRGYSETAALAAQNLEEAELRYGEINEEPDVEAGPWAQLALTNGAAVRARVPALGLFSYPDGR